MSIGVGGIDEVTGAAISAHAVGYCYCNGQGRGYCRVGGEGELGPRAFGNGGARAEAQADRVIVQYGDRGCRGGT